MVHEIGHLFGARHDIDPKVLPYAYGHGFVAADESMRTIMAYPNNCGLDQIQDTH